MKELKDLLSAVNACCTKGTDLRQTISLNDGPLPELDNVPWSVEPGEEGIIDNAIRDMIGKDGFELLNKSTGFLKGESHIVVRIGILNEQ